MNFKTTAFLGIGLVVVAGWFVLQRPEEGIATETPIASVASRNSFEQPLFAEPPKNIVNLTCVRGDGPAWRFERTNPEADSSQAKWRMTEPFEVSVPRYEIDGIVNQLKNLRYQIKYASGDADGVTAAQAGLEPPKMRVTLVDIEGQTFEVYVGKTVSSSETYVRLGSSSDIYVARSSLGNLLKKHAREYRDKKLMDFDAGDVVAMDILHRPEEGEPVAYRIVKHAGDWVFEKPFSADALDKPIDDAIRAAARLRAGEWVESADASRLGRFGLSPARLEVEITVEKTVTIDVEPDDEESSGDIENESDAPEPETTQEIQTKRYAFQLSGRGPIGKDTYVYGKMADDSAVATIIKSTADKLIPVIGKWRDLKICPTKVTTATKIQLSTREGESATFAKNDEGEWIFEDSGELADDSAVNNLLRKIESVKALNYVDGEDPTGPRFGLVPPIVQIVITVPGNDQPERIAVGDPTDEVTKRLYYLRRGESTSVAKIRAIDAALLKRSPTDYLNREILKLAAADMETIEVTRPNSVTGETETIVLTQSDGAWRMSSPVEAETDPAAVNQLVRTLSNFRAESVAARSGDPGRFGLDDSAVRVTIRYNAPPAESDSSDEAGESDIESQIAPKTLELRLAESGKKPFAMRTDRPAIYVLKRGHFEAFAAEYHAKNVLSFEQSEAVAISVTADGVTHEFAKPGEEWVYAAEPDLPIDGTKVTNLLLQVHDLKLKAFVRYAAPDLSVYGLDQPGRKVAVSIPDGQQITLLVSDKPCAADGDGSFYAVIEGTADVFLLTPDTVSRFEVNLDEFEKSDDS